MTRRARRDEEQENHERWLVSYADFITLLFAFFVVMYAISSVNDGKYRVLSDSLTSAFRSGESVRPQAQTGSSNIITPVIIITLVGRSIRSHAASTGANTSRLSAAVINAPLAMGDYRGETEDMQEGKPEGTHCQCDK